MYSFQDNVALITGASRGIGRALALELGSRGCDLILLARNATALHSLREEITRRYSRRVLVFALDVVDHARMQLAIAESLDSFSGINIVVCNAGIGQFGPVHKTAFGDMEMILRVNTLGALNTVSSVLPHMVKRRSGSITFISSVLGKRAVQYNAAYCASKYALHGFADALRLEVRRSGIHVGVVCPARTETDFFAHMIYSTPQLRRRKVPVASPEFVARHIARAIANRRREVIVSPGGKLWSFVGSHFPRTTDWILQKAVPRIADE